MFLNSSTGLSYVLNEYAAAIYSIKVSGVWLVLRDCLDHLQPYTL
jgi:hypothetical protein